MAVLKVPVTSKDHIQGDAAAHITLVEYGDYQCPYCALAYPEIKKLQQHYGSKLKFVFRNFPMKEAHQFAEAAAEAAEFAADRNLFWETHDYIYENHEDLSIPFLYELSDRIKLPANDLKSAIDNQTYAEKIHDDFLGGVRSGVNGTPGIFINEHKFNGAVEFADLVEIIDSILEQKS